MGCGSASSSSVAQDTSVGGFKLGPVVESFPSFMRGVDSSVSPVYSLVFGSVSSFLVSVVVNFLSPSLVDEITQSVRSGDSFLFAYALISWSLSDV